MKKKIGILIGLMLVFSMVGALTPTVAKVEKMQLTTFEVVIPWGLDHERGKIIKSMIDNSSIAGDYNFVYTAVGGGPSDRDALKARFMAGDYPNLIICTLDWYTEFATFKDFWVDFNTTIDGWTGGKVGWQADIPDGWWSILDKQYGNGSGDGVYALPFFGQSIIPYINTDHFKDVGLNWTTDLDTIDEWVTACETLAAGGYTPFAMVGKLQSDLAYMNYMLASTDNLINSSVNPATVFSWGASNEYGLNGSMSVDGFTTYLKMKGEGWVPTTVETDGGGEANAIFGAGNASMVFCGPWGTSIFEGDGLENFTAVHMPATSDGKRSTIIGGGMSMIPKYVGNTTEIDDAKLLAEWLLEDVNQMKTVENWLNTAWRIPVRRSVTEDPWFTAFDNRSNFLTHVDSQNYTYAWGRQHPVWMDVHEAIVMPGYLEALQSVSRGADLTDAEYRATAQHALNKMAAKIQCYYLDGPCIEIPEYTTITVVETTVVETVVTDIVTSIVTSVVQAPGFSILVLIGGIVPVLYLRKKKK
jgi:hypothetical protein